MVTLWSIKPVKVAVCVCVFVLVVVHCCSLLFSLPKLSTRRPPFVSSSMDALPLLLSPGLSDHSSLISLSQQGLPFFSDVNPKMGRKNPWFVSLSCVLYWFGQDGLLWLLGVASPSPSSRSLAGTDHEQLTLSNPGLPATLMVLTISLLYSSVDRQFLGSPSFDHRFPGGVERLKRGR